MKKQFSSSRPQKSGLLISSIRNSSHLALLLACCLAGGIGSRTYAESTDNEAQQTNSVPAGKPKGFVTVATIGSAQLTVSPETEPQVAVKRVIAHWQKLFNQVLPDQPDLIVVPEACDRPRGLSKEGQKNYYLARGTQVQDFFAETARKNHCYIIYSAKRLTEDGTWRNSSVMLDREGKAVGIYNKNYPTIGEIDKGILCGKQVSMVECDFGRVGMAICFDLNFDDLRQRYAEEQPDLIAFSSMYHGGLMQQYWAYSCRSHFVGAITGRDKPSQIRDPLGNVIASNTNYFDSVVTTINLDCELVHLDENWGRLRALKAKYGPKVKITDPGQLGAVLIASEHETISIDAMIDEFQLERLDDYLNRSRAHRLKTGNMEP